MCALRFPVAQGSQSFFPTNSVCPICEAKRVGEPHEFVGLSGGAASESGENGEGFLTIYAHPQEVPPFASPQVVGAPIGQSEGAELEIVRDTNFGQFDLCFCSTSCLRRFLNTCVDELERTLRKPAV
jgi:hypothetical protein